MDIAYGNSVKIRVEVLPVKKDGSNVENTEMMKISVRSLVEFIFRSGDIDSRRTGAREKQAMEAGSRIHRKIQRQMGSGYASEVSLKHLVQLESCQLQVEGRADGIFREKAEVYLEKILQMETYAAPSEPGLESEVLFGDNGGEKVSISEQSAGVKQECVLSIERNLSANDASEKIKSVARILSDQHLLAAVVAAEQESGKITEEKETGQTKKKTLKKSGRISDSFYLSVIDEIKGVYRSLRNLKEPVFVHKAQALCYAYIYALQNHQSMMGVQITYCHLETEEIRRFYEVYSFETLQQWFTDLVQTYGKWAELELQMQREMRESLQGMEFPFPYRPGQRKLAVSVYRSIMQKGELFIQAPTGIGKTMSVLFPALKAMGEGMGERVFYLTAKTITRTVAQEALKILRGQGLKIHSVTITAKDKICPMEERTCNPELCPRAKGHFDRVNEALYDMITHVEQMEREEILSYAERYEVCPFEMNLDLSLWCQAIVCDYNYVYDPNVYLRRFFAEGVQGNYLFLVDEAHNLPDRAREMYSATLVKEEVLLAEKLLKPVMQETVFDTSDAERAAGRAVKALRKLNKMLLEKKKETEQVLILEKSEIDRICDVTADVQDCMSSFLEETRSPVEDELLDFYFAIRHFNAMYGLLGDSYVTYCSYAEGRFFVRLLCANPAENIHSCGERGLSTVYFSATMLPMHYYKELLTTEDKAFAVYVDSPFDPSKRLLAIADDVSSLYSRRSVRQYERVLEYILTAARVKTGNYMVFFPSYQYMMEVVKVLQNRHGVVLAADIADIVGIAGKEAVRRLSESGLEKDLYREVIADTDIHDFITNAENSRISIPELDIDLLIQKQGMRETDRDAFLREFAADEENHRSLVGFCVIGGIFSEGIDLIGEKLIGTVIVGTGLARISTEGEILKNYFDSQGKPGYDYAYRFPGINKVFQAAGRVIRTAEDEGIIVLLDNRLLLENHVKLFPMDWANYQAVSLREIETVVRIFWEGSKRRL